MTPTARRIFVILIALIGLIGLPTSILLERSLAASLLDQIEQDLGSQAMIAAVAAERGDSRDLDQLADQLGEETGARYTFIRRDGKVLGDSELDGDALSSMDDHSQRPEVLQALATSRGISVRRSATLGQDLLYVAVPHGQDGSVVRIAMPTPTVRAAVSRMRTMLASALAVALGLAILGSWLAARLVNAQFESLLAEARTLAAHPPVEDDEEEEEEDEPSDPGISTENDRLEGQLSTAVRALAEQRDLVRAVVDGIQDGVVAINAKGRVDLANAAALDLLGWSKVPRGKRIRKRVPKVLADHIDEVQELGSIGAELAFDLRRVEVASAGLQETGGLVLVLRDVTELRRLERVRRDFVANVSHELGTPVAVVRANTETLLHGGALDDPVGRVRFTEAIDRQALRLSELIADLLQISRIEAGELPLDLEAMALSDAFESVIDSTSSKAKQRGCTVTAEPTTLTVFADPRAMHSVLENLVINAIKYGDGTVVLSAERSDVHTRIYVRDDGPGIIDKHRERVFERFYRVDKGRSREVGGTGLGLSIVRNLVHAMGGRVGVDEAPEGGAAFWIEL